MYPKHIDYSSTLIFTQIIYFVQYGFDKCCRKMIIISYWWKIRWNYYNYLHKTLQWNKIWYFQPINSRLKISFHYLLFYFLYHVLYKSYHTEVRSVYNYFKPFIYLLLKSVTVFDYHRGVVVNASDLRASSGLESKRWC